MKNIVLLLMFLFPGVLLADHGKVEDSLFVVESADGSRGSAFLMKDDDGIWMVSNYHVVSSSNRIEFVSMNNKERKLELPEELEIAKDRDVVRFRVNEECGFDMASGWEFDDVVYAYGNSGGLGIITKSKGAVVGKGLKDVEVSCEIIPGNSGGPVINDKNQVVGVASYIVKPTALAISKNMSETFSASKLAWLEDKLKEVKGTRYEDTRRFAIPLKDVVWQKFSLENFRKESAEFVERRSLYHRLDKIISMSLDGTVKISETMGEPVLEKRWVQKYNKEVPSSFHDGRLYGRPSDFFKRYSKMLFDMHDLMAAAVDAQREQTPSVFTSTYFSSELSDHAEHTAKLIDFLNMAAEEYKTHR